MIKNTPKWLSGKPIKSGFYIIAILYENGLGSIETDYWDSEQGWSVEYEVVGHIPLRQVLNAAGVEFPDTE
ncbi:MAG: hypothetical protein K6L75_16070 [Cellvibrionaceae bacterium]